MPTYVFRCPSCGPFDHRAAITAVPATVACGRCGERAPRGVTAPALHVPGGRQRVAAAHERSAHAPDVVPAVPPGPAPGAAPRPAAAPDPRLARLPRP